MFSHLTLLNHHKRIHNQDANENGQESITVVTQAQNIVQAQNLVSENGQPLGQIQIVATESLEPATTHTIQQAAEVTVSTAKSVTLEKSKCITCGNIILQNQKRKGPKLIRCETCINNDNSNLNTRATATQIFVAPDGDVKFEMSELPSGTSESSMDSLGTQNVIPIAQATTTNTNNNVQNVVKINQAQNQGNILPGHHPVKKRNLASVTKCQKCNGSGVIFIGGGQRQVKTE